MFLASRRADERALKVPKHALSIFLMMLPLATAIFDSTKTKPASSSQSSLVRLTAEQKRKVTTLVELETKKRRFQQLTRAFSWLKAPTSTYTQYTILGHYAKQALKPPIPYDVCAGVPISCPLTEG